MADPAADFDPAALWAYLTGVMGPADGRLSRISGGQSNPTYRVDWGDHALVLRKKPAGPILRGAHAIEREYRVLSALAPTDVPVPEPVLLEEDSAILGTPFYLMRHVPGSVVADTSMPGASPARRREVYLDMARTLAAIHNLDPLRIGLDGFGKPANYFQRQLALWGGQLDAASADPGPELPLLRDWLTRNLPPDDGRLALTHGDYRLGNLMLGTGEAPIVAVLDWELSTLGHPMADLGFCTMPWITAPDEYGGLLGHDIDALGIPTQQEFVDHYMAHARRPQPLLPFHRAFALFRFAVIFVGIAERARKGTAAGGNARELAPLARAFARRGLDLIDA